MIRIKICGITNLDDALAAVDSGADALGFVFYDRSPRKVAPAVAARIVAELPPFVTKVGVFVDSPLEMVKETISRCNLDLAQLHGSENPAFCHALHPRVVKAFRVSGWETMSLIAGYTASAYLLDAYRPGIVGGTGETFDWEIARAVSATHRVILAGGLSAANVGQAIATVRPYGVDVSTSVESSPGKKDAELMRDFIRAARMAAEDQP